MNLGYSKNNCVVYYDNRSTHAQTHIAKHPVLLELVKQIIPTIELTGEVLRLDINTGKTIGTTDLVETKEEDEIIYALRVGRNIYSRFVKNRQATETTYVTIDIRYDSVKKDWYLYTIFIGRLTPSFPGGDFMSEQSLQFWSTHALVWGNQEIIAGSETKICPW